MPNNVDRIEPIISESNRLQSEVRRLLDILRTPHGPVCAWCKNRRYPVKQMGLCGHCNRIRLALARDEKGKRTWELSHKIRLQKAKIKRCKLEGFVREHCLDRPVSGLDIERDITLLSKLILRKELFYGDANWFTQGFTPDQRILLHYFLAEISNEYARQNRLKFAMGDVLDEIRRTRIRKNPTRSGYLGLGASRSENLRSADRSRRTPSRSAR